MPMTQVSMRAGRSAPFRAAVLKGIHESLQEALGVHPEAFFMTITEHEDANFHANTTFPFKRSLDLLLVQITLTTGRSAADKQRFYEHLVSKLQATLRVDPADVFVNIIEVVSTLSIAGRPVVNLRYFPRLAAGQHETPAVNELVLSVMDNAQIAGVWTGEGKLSFPVAEGEEISDLQPVRVGAGFRGSMAYSVTDLITLSDKTK